MKGEMNVGVYLAVFSISHPACEAVRGGFLFGEVSLVHQQTKSWIGSWLKKIGLPE